MTRFLYLSLSCLIYLVDMEHSKEAKSMILNVKMEVI